VPKQFAAGAAPTCSARDQLDIQSIRPQIACRTNLSEFSVPPEYSSARAANRRNPMPDSFRAQQVDGVLDLFWTARFSRVCHQMQAIVSATVHPTNSEKGVRFVAAKPRNDTSCFALPRARNFHRR